MHEALNNRNRAIKPS